MNSENPVFQVIFRTCDKVVSLHKDPRPFGLSKTELIKICFCSLHQSLQGKRHAIRVLGDDLSPAMVAFFKGYGVPVVNDRLGNDESLRRSFAMARECADEEWVYCCEDDYLHTADAFTAISTLITNRRTMLYCRPYQTLLRLFIPDVSQKDLCIHPSDYPDRYLRHYRRFSLLFLAPDRHWRQISNATFTLLMQAKTIKKHYPLLQTCCTGADDGLLSKKLFGRYRKVGPVLCVSPIPGVATHLHENVMSPFVNWAQRVDEIKRCYGLS